MLGSAETVSLEQQTLARWSGWGALPEVFEHRPDAPLWAQRTQELLVELLTEDEYAAARRSTINAHYTSPLVAEVVWDALQGIGWQPGGRVWEPGSGIGVFMATAPPEVALDGVELDPVTARLAARLHRLPEGRHRIDQGGLEHAAVEGQYQAAVGNVPFADVVPHVASNPDGLSLHNLAIRQAIRAVEPGGLAALVTSSWTLDAKDTRQREALGAEARFVGAIRLPEQAFSEQSGTRVTTDIVVFQRHRPDDLAALDGWKDVVDLAIGERSVRINEWFRDHPDLVVGSIEAGGLYGADQLTVRLGGDLEPPLRQALKRLVEVAESRRHTPLPRDTPWYGETRAVEHGRPAEPLRRPGWVKIGGIYQDPELPGAFRQVQANGTGEPIEARPKKDREVLGQLVELRDIYYQLIEAELQDDPAMQRHRDDLNRLYDTIVDKNGPLSQVRVSVRKDGAEVRRRPSWGGFRHDPDYATLLGLEYYNEETNTAVKAAIFEHRQLRPPQTNVAGTADTIEEAVAVSLHRHGSIDVASVSEAMAIDVDDVEEALEDSRVAFHDPGTGLWVDRASYLAGDVRSKLRAAEEAGMGVNAEELRTVLPADLTIDQIDAQLGVPWVTPNEVRQFIEETFEMTAVSDLKIAYDPHVGWSFSPRSSMVWRNRESLTQTWGTERKSALDLVAHGLKNEPVTVYDTVEVGEGRKKQIVNYEDTVEANQRLDAINLAFHDWLGSDPERSVAITTRYNHAFRSRAPYQGEPWQQPAGLADHIQLRTHQLTTLRRIIQNESVGVWHSVGAGKTLVMASAAMELRRLGIAQKPMMVVPNHLVAQIAAETRQAFPAASVLVLEGSAPELRRRFASQVAAGDWDAVVVSQTAFKAFPVDPATEVAYIEKRTEELRAALSSVNTQLDGPSGSSSTGGRSVKQIEKRIARLEERVRGLLDSPSDASLRWEALGVDAVMIDEAHAYKNLEIVTARTDLASAASQRASDMDMKLTVMRDTLHQPRIVLASGTPLSNSFHEMWVMMRLTDPGTLRAVGVEHFDAFVAQFGQMVSDYELGPTGFKLKSRFASFRNVPELQQLFAQTGDVKLPEDLDLPRPRLAGGEPERLVIPSSPEMVAYIEELAYRANHMPDDPRVDNHLRLLGDFRRAAVSLDLVGRQEPAINKIDTVAEAIANRWHAEKNLRFIGEDGAPHPTPGSLQIVFCDLGVPGGTGPDLYNRLRDTLRDLGVPYDKVAFVHEARDLNALYRRAREGDVAVLVGSTEKMGTGMNAQTRATALYHVDPPWRPADIEQRNGRILRQGNQNEEVSVVYAIAEGSGDTLSYQGLERKKRMIDLVLRNQNEARRVEATDSDDVTFGDLKGLASGDPRVIDLLRAKRALGQIEVDAQAHERRMVRARRKVPQLTEQIERAENVGNHLAHYAARAGQQIDLTSGGELSDDRQLNETMQRLLPRGQDETAPVAFFGPDPVLAQRQSDQIVFSLNGGSQRIDLRANLPLRDLRNANIPLRIKNALAKLPERHSDHLEVLEAMRRDLDQAKRNSGRPFERAVELAEARTTVAQIEAELAAETADTPDQGVEPTKAPGTDLGAKVPAAERSRQR